MRKKQNKAKVRSFWSQFVWVVLFLSLLVWWYSYNQEKIAQMRDTTLSLLIQEIENSEVENIVVRGNNIEVAYHNGEAALLKKEVGVGVTETFTNLGITEQALKTINIDIQNEQGAAFWFKSLLPFLFPLLLIILFLWFILGQTRGSAGQVFSFGRSQARFIDPKDTTHRVTFKDVAGAEEAKEELKEFVDFLRSPQKYFALGASVPRGILLTGLPGTGKTLLARAIAGEARVPFFSISASEFVEMFVGVGASRVRDLFKNAKKIAPAIIFIDEIDAIGRARGSGVGGGNDEREQTLNQILVEMDGFEQGDKLIVIAATNRAEVLDAALLRPGRFDRKVIVDTPSVADREKILQVHARGKKLAKDVDLKSIAKRTAGLSGADLASIMNEGAILAARQNKTIASQKDLYNAIEKVLLGPERKTSRLSEREKTVVAYHEAGHALLASVLPYADPVQKISIVSRGSVGGYVMNPPERDRSLHTRQQFVDDITVLLGGFVTEELVFGDVSSGPQNDLTRVSDIARSMVTRFGMSASVGPMSVQKKGDFAYADDVSEKMAENIDAEVKKIVQQSYKKATSLIKKHRKALEALVKKLREVETLERPEFEAFLKAHKVIIQNKLT